MACLAKTLNTSKLPVALDDDTLGWCLCAYIQHVNATKVTMLTLQSSTNFLDNLLNLWQLIDGQSLVSSEPYLGLFMSVLLQYIANRSR